MSRRTWSIELDGERRRVEVDHAFWSGTTTLRVDGKTVIHTAPGFGGFADHWFGPSESVAQLDRHELRLRITPNLSYTLDLIVDGRSASTGLLVPSLPRPPDDAVYRLGKLGASVAMIALPYIFVITFVFGRFAPEWGPRWFAANDLALTSGTVPLMGGMGLYFINLVRRPSTIAAGVVGRVWWFGFGLLALWIALWGAMDVPREIADVIRAPETRSVTVVSTSETSGHPPSIRTADGATYEWVSTFGVYTYPRVGPGTYEIVVTAVGHRLVGIRPAP